MIEIFVNGGLASQIKERKASGFGPTAEMQLAIQTGLRASQMVRNVVTMSALPQSILPGPYTGMICMKTLVYQQSVRNQH